MRLVCQYTIDLVPKVAKSNIVEGQLGFNVIQSNEFGLPLNANRLGFYHRSLVVNDVVKNIVAVEDGNVAVRGGELAV